MIEAKNKEYYDLNVGKKKRPKQKNVDLTTKKETMFDTLAKRAASVPAPWKYDLTHKWAEDGKDIPTKEMQIAMYQWQGVAKDDMNIKKQDKTKQKKLDMSIKKYTYIDWIVMNNTKKDYPKPGPDNYFMDLGTAKKYYKENLELFNKKEKSEIEKNKLP